jgi:hypothetical protein
MPDDTMPACPGADNPADRLLDTTDIHEEDE